MKFGYNQMIWTNFSFDQVVDIFANLVQIIPIKVFKPIIIWPHSFLSKEAKIKFRSQSTKLDIWFCLGRSRIEKLGDVQQLAKENKFLQVIASFR